MANKRSPDPKRSITNNTSPVDDSEKSKVPDDILDQRDLLLSLNEDIAKAENKTQVLDLIHPKLKMLFGSDDIFICLLENESKTLKPFLRTARPERKLITEYHEFMEAHLNAGHQFINTIVQSLQPVVYELEDVKYWAQPPRYIATLLNAGLRSSISMVLRDAGVPIGVVTIWHERKNAFDQHHIRLLQTVAAQVSMALTNIIDNEKINQRDNESDLLHLLSNKIAAVKNQEDLSHFLSFILKSMVPYHAAVISVFSEENKIHRVYAEDIEAMKCNTIQLEHLLNNNFGTNRFQDTEILRPVILKSKDFQIVEDELIKQSFDSAIEETTCVVLAEGNQPIGLFLLFSNRPGNFKNSHLNIIKRISYQLSLTVTKLLAQEEIIARKNEKALLLSFSNQIAAVRHKEDFLAVVNSNLKKIFSVDGFAIGLLSEDGLSHSPFLFDLSATISNDADFRKIIRENYPVADGIFDRVLSSDEPVHIRVSDLGIDGNIPAYVQLWKRMNIDFVIGVALKPGDKNLGVLLFHLPESRAANINTYLLKGVCAQLSIALSHILANEKISTQLEEIRRYKEQLEEEKLYLQEEVRSGFTYKDVIGAGPAMQKVFQQLSQVAFANSTVLLLGETGTGKELIARAIHNLSARKDKLMVKINCAAMPVNLIESELFGHEKGSFTGATDRRIGKFELANEGTLFLDEIGEMPFELQAKLLRAVQEREIERIGGKTTIKINVRLIAATNRNLLKEVEEGRFRQDLFYRLNVFPITLPALRDRKEDIPELVNYFITKYSKNAGSKVSFISGKAMKQLMAYTWPGNVRELEHFIERSVLTTTGSTIKNAQFPTTGEDKSKSSNEEKLLKSLDQNERDHIIRILNYCKGKISGAGGAAEILGVPVSTLNSKIKKLGIEKSNRYTVKDNV
jgi:formate hydrogenlyase transcriptional activator